MLTGLFACGSPTVSEPRGDKLARVLCECSAPLLALNKAAQSAPDSLAFRNIAVEFEKARSCAARLGIQPEDRIALDLALNSRCPALAAYPDLLAELLGQ
ncbi:MAG: hypothetical protein ACKVT2_17735 [Saprospiraceae bacterium]